jgi:glycosyltransferase involved in cell wall biosynthesis
MIMTMPKVSILMGTYNRAHLLSPTIQSVLDQTFADWELVVADDGSSDSTPAVIAEWTRKDSRISYVRSDANQGISKNYNMGFAMTRGEYIAMIDDDDPWCDREKLAKQVRYLDAHPDVVGVGGGVIVVDPEGREKYRYLKPETDAEIRAKMLFSNPMANSTTMFRRSIAEAVGWYDESTRYAGDRDFWLKAGLRGALYNFPEYFSFYTMGTHNTSIAKLRPHLKASFMIMRRYRGKYPSYPLAFLFNFAQYAYSFLPGAVRGALHVSLARLKRRVVG